MKMKISVTLLSLFLLSGCGGGGGSSTTPPATSTGYLVDANVSGVSYTSGSQSGTTDTSGKFTYEVGSKIIFTIGGVKLGEFDTSNIKSDKTIYPAELAGVDRNNTTDTKVLQIAQFLQSLDSDNNPDNGITINETVRTNLSGSTLDFTSGVVAQSDLNNTIQTVAQKTIRTQTQVLQHYRETLQSANITLPNLAPNTSSQTINTNEDVGYSFNSSIFTNGFSDIDGDTLTKIKITTLPTHGTLKLTDTNIALNDEINIADLAHITYTPNTNYHGNDRFSGQGYDGTTWSNEANLTITIASINDEPTITSSNTATVNENQTSALTITATDADSDTLTYSISGGDSGSFDINDSTGVVTFKVAPDFETKSSYTFSATASDESATDSQSVTITINNIVEQTAPILANTSISIDENTSFLTKLGTYDTGSGYSFDGIISSDGTKAYITNYYSGLVILDISNPAAPSLLGSYDTAGDAWNITLSSDGTKAYVADGYNGLVIVDISNPVSPTLLGSYDTVGVAWDITLSSDGTKAYVADEGNGLVILDISIPSSPTLVGSYDTVGYALGITLSSDGTKAYIADNNSWDGGSSGDGLVILDISNPATPSLLGSYDTAGDARNITLSSDGTKAYVADEGNGLVILDISNPAAPSLLGSYDTAGDAWNITLSSDGTKAYVADGYNGLVIVDISTLVSPTLLGSYKFLNSANEIGEATDVSLSSDGSKAFVTYFDGWGRGYLEIVNISSGITIGEVGVVSNGGSEISNFTISGEDSKYFKVDLNGTVSLLKDVDFEAKSSYNLTLFATNSVGNSQSVELKINVKDIMMELLGIYRGNQYSDSHSAVVLSSDGTKAYVADWYNGFLILDISNPASPLLLGSYDTAGAAIDVTLSSDGTKAFVADGSSGLVILDISIPSSPTLLSSYDTAGITSGVTLSSDSTKAYIADGSNGLVILDISNPAAPSLLGSYDTVGVAHDVTLSSDGTKAYIADDVSSNGSAGDGLVILDISNPSTPTLLGIYDNMARKPLSVTLSSDGTKAYIADWYNSLEILDISNPSSPTFVDLFFYNGASGLVKKSIAISSDGSKAFIADMSNGLLIVDIKVDE